MSRHVFVDESYRGSRSIVVGAVVEDADRAAFDRMLRQLRMPGQQRVHFAKERDARRGLVLSRLAAARVRTRVYQGTGGAEEVRAACLRRLVLDCGETAGRFVLERRDAAGDGRDRAQIAAAVRDGGLEPSRVRYEHVEPHVEPALWVADAVAWCHGVRGKWRQRAEPLIDAVVDLGHVDAARRRLQRVR